MKNVMTLVICLALVTMALAQTPKKPAASQKRSGRDLYLNKEEPGAKMTIELKRDGKTQFVPPDTEFRSGDKVAFHFEVNFNGYVAVINDGTSGKKSLLFPYENVSNKIPANQTYRVPQTGAWFEFDNRPGEEKLIFIMSTNPLPGINQPAAGGGSTGGPATGDQEQQILNEVNSRALRKGRDLGLVKEENAGYVTTSQQSLSEPIGLLLKLIHR
jgi:hypothetical protein